MENSVIGIPFASHVDQNAKPVIDDAKTFLKKAYVRFFSGNDNLTRFGVYKLMGYRYNFKPFLNLYLYKQYGHWTEIYAPNKTSLRQVVGGRIDKIILLEKGNL